MVERCCAFLYAHSHCSHACANNSRDDVSVFSVPRECVGYVTGRGGSALRSIEEEFGALMIFVKDKATEGQPGAGDRSADAGKLSAHATRLRNLIPRVPSS